jgi:hypothetical protein
MASLTTAARGYQPCLPASDVLMHCEPSLNQVRVSSDNREASIEDIMRLNERMNGGTGSPGGTSPTGGSPNRGPEAGLGVTALHQLMRILLVLRKRQR